MLKSLKKVINEEKVFKNISPYHQGGAFVGLVIVAMILVKLLSLVTEVDPINYWIISASLLLFYIVANSLLSLTAESKTTYYGQSVMTFIVVAFLSGLVAQLFSGIHLNEAGSLSWIYKLLVAIFLVLISIVNLMSKIVEMAKKPNKRFNNEE